MCWEAWRQHPSWSISHVETAQVTAWDLVEVMNTCLRVCECQAYFHKYMKSKLTEHYGDDIVFCHLHRRDGVVHLTNEKKKNCFCLHNPTRRLMSSRSKRTACAILRDFYKEARKSDTEAETIRLIKAAASLIRSDIASFVDSKDVYPDTQSIRDHQNYVPRYTCSMWQRKIATWRLFNIGATLQKWKS